MEERTYFGMFFEFNLEGEETQAKITDVEAVQVVIVNWIWTEVPGVSCMLSELQSEYCFELGDFLMC
jgi:hypothetical protein